MATSPEPVAHTPGPWWTDAEYSEEECGIAIIAANTDCGPLPGNPTRGMVAWASELLPENSAQCEANALLIAAAPELLEALKEAHRCLSMYEWYNNPKSGWAPDDKTSVRGAVEGALARAVGAA